ncbi:MAG: hypothetical protein RLZZ303_1696 [Candidatus Hydrogenedentota bacterium]
MPVPMLDLKAQYATLRDETNAAVLRVLESQTFRGGPETVAFESELAAFGQTRHALGVSSGTDALLLLFKAAGIGPGDEVITTPFTFFATAGALVNAGAMPVFVDIEPDTLNINPELVEAQITEKTKALLPVHIFGQSANMDAFRALAEKHGLLLLEDNAQSLGATWRGARTGSIGLGSAVSFYPTKNLGGAGEGGAILTSDDALADRVKLLRCHGSPVQYEHIVVGTNSHLHELQAAILRVKLRHLAEWNDARRHVARIYDALFADMPEITLPYMRPEGKSVYHQYVIRVPRRDEALQRLREHGVGCGVYYPKGLHQQECFQGIARSGPCPETERACREVLALPMYPELSQAQQSEVVGLLKEHLAQAGR